LQLGESIQLLMGEILTCCRVLRERIGEVTRTRAVIHVHAAIQRRSGIYQEGLRQGRVHPRPVGAVCRHSSPQRSVELHEGGWSIESSEARGEAEGEGCSPSQQVGPRLVEQAHHMVVRCRIGDERRRRRSDIGGDIYRYRVLRVRGEDHQKAVGLNGPHKSGCSALLGFTQELGRGHRFEQPTPASDSDVLVGPVISAKGVASRIELAHEQLADEAGVRAVDSQHLAAQDTHVQGEILNVVS
jgi:hypothetical protein